MPYEIPLLVADTWTPWIPQKNTVILYLDTDARFFWGVIRRHVMREDMYTTPHMASSVAYRMYPDMKGDIPDVSARGVFVWKEDYYAPTGYWSGVRIAWEPISLVRVRVVVAAVGDLVPNLRAAHDVLTAIRQAYPESHSQLPDIVGLVESWAYDEATAEQWRGEAATGGIAGDDQGSTTGAPLPDMPPKLGTDGSTWDDLFDWWYRGGRVEFPTLKEVAGLVGMSSKTVYNHHSNYKAEHGPSALPNTKSKFAGSSGK